MNSDSQMHCWMVGIFTILFFVFSDSFKVARVIKKENGERTYLAFLNCNTAAKKSSIVIMCNYLI